MKFESKGKTYYLGFKYENPVLDKMIKKNKALLDIIGKNLTKAELMIVLRVPSLPKPKITKCYVRSEEDPTPYEGKSILHSGDKFNAEEGRRRAIKDLTRIVEKDFSTLIWQTYNNRKHAS